MRLTYVLALVLVAGLARQALALGHTCTIGSIKQCCDTVCGSGSCSTGSCSAKTCAGGAHKGECCITNADCPSSTCVDVSGCAICGVDTTSEITGSGGNDLICTGGSGTGVTLKIVHGGGGDDTIAPGTVLDGSGNSVNSAALGASRIEGGGGNDFIATGDGDDIILGQGGDDLIIACGGRNYVHGGSGDDTIAGAAFPVCAGADDVVGSILCGGDDDDTLLGAGPAHQCMDGGDGTNSCTYVYGPGPRSATAFDVGTMRNCTPATDTNESCGCEEQTLPTN